MPICQRPVDQSIVGDRVILPENKYGISKKKRSLPLSLSQIMLFAAKMIGWKWLYQENTALYICFSINKKRLRGP